MEEPKKSNNTEVVGKRLSILASLAIMALAAIVLLYYWHYGLPPLTSKRTKYSGGIITDAAKKELRPAVENDTHSMVYIPPGKFIMGTSDKEVRRLAAENNVHLSLFQHESPRRELRLDDFWIDRYPVTNADYKKFIDATDYKRPLGWKLNNLPQGDNDYPVTNVTWEDANAYAKWAGKRLPTEAEWEKAARGTDGRTYPWGDKWDDSACLTNAGQFSKTYACITVVGCFPRGASPYGVMDLAGNVAEWTATPTAPPDSNKKKGWYVVKGAANVHKMKFNFRCASRIFSAHESRRHPWLGFRCVKDAPPESKAPDPNEYGRQKIRITTSKSRPRALFHVPYFPEASFSLTVPEHAGADGYRFDVKEKGPTKWDINPNGTGAEYKCIWEEIAILRVMLQSGFDHVDFIITIKNLSDKRFANVFSNSCFQSCAAPHFNDPERMRTMVWTDEGPVRVLDMPIHGTKEILHGGWEVANPDQQAPKGGKYVRFPFIFIVSRDRSWIVAQAYGESKSVKNNAHLSCLHSQPIWPDIPPGKECSATGKLYFLKGPPGVLLERWKRDFGR